MDTAVMKDVMIKLPAIYRKPVFKVDRSVKLEFETREVSGVDLALLADLRETEGHLLFSPNAIDEAEVPEEKANAELKGKTQAGRLRGVIYRVWESHGKKGDFDSYYKNIMENLIEQMKEKIEDGLPR